MLCKKLSDDQNNLGIRRLGFKIYPTESIPFTSPLWSLNFRIIEDEEMLVVFLIILLTITTWICSESEEHGHQGVTYSSSESNDKKLYLSLQSYKILFVSCPSCPLDKSTSQLLPPLFYWHRGLMRAIPNIETAIRLGYNETEGPVIIPLELFKEVRHGQDIPSLVLDKSVENPTIDMSMGLELQRIRLLHGSELIYSTYKFGKIFNPAFIEYELPDGNGETVTSILMSHRGDGQSYLVWLNDVLNFNDPGLSIFDLHSNDVNISSAKFPINVHEYLSLAEDIRLIKTPKGFSAGGSMYQKLSFLFEAASEFRVTTTFSKVTWLDGFPSFNYLCVMHMATLYFDQKSHSIKMTKPVEMLPNSEVTDGKEVRIQKNWVPFEVNNVLYFVYSICPFHVITVDVNAPITATSVIMKTVSRTACNVDQPTRRRALKHENSVAHSMSRSIGSSRNDSNRHRDLSEDLSDIRPNHQNHRYFWDWGELRGGTSAILIHNKFYLTFFHSKRDIHTDYGVQSIMFSYFFGAYIFSATPPFHMLKISRAPIVHDEWYKRPTAANNSMVDYVVYPLSFYLSNETARTIEDRKVTEETVAMINLSVGRNDDEGWIVKLRLDVLLASLVSVHP